MLLVETHITCLSFNRDLDSDTEIYILSNQSSDSVHRQQVTVDKVNEKPAGEM